MPPTGGINLVYNDASGGAKRDVLAVSPSTGLADGYLRLADIVAAARDKPDTITYGTSGVASITHAAMEDFADRARDSALATRAVLRTF